MAKHYLVPLSLRVMAKAKLETSAPGSRGPHLPVACEPLKSARRTISASFSAHEEQPPLLTATLSENASERHTEEEKQGAGGGAARTGSYIS